MQMDIREVLQFVDNALYDKTGKHLNDLQRAIIEGTVKQQKYSEIAENNHRSEGHVKDVGYELLQMLSNIFGEEVDKGNLKSVLERQGNLNIWGNTGNTIGNSNIIGYINVCSDKPTASSNQSQDKTSDFEQAKYQAKIEMVGKLRQIGLSNEQIADTLGLALEKVKQVD